MTDENRAKRLAALFAELVELVASPDPTSVPVPRSPSDQTLLTVEEAAERLRIGRTRMFALVKSGEIDSVQIGRLRRIHIRELDAYAERLRNNYRTKG